MQMDTGKSEVKGEKLELKIIPCILHQNQSTRAKAGYLKFLSLYIAFGFKLKLPPYSSLTVLISLPPALLFFCNPYHHLTYYGFYLLLKFIIYCFCFFT